MWLCQECPILATKWSLIMLMGPQWWNAIRLAMFACGQEQSLSTWLGQRAKVKCHHLVNGTDWFGGWLSAWVVPWVVQLQRYRVVGQLSSGNSHLGFWHLTVSTFSAFIEWMARYNVAQFVVYLVDLVWLVWAGLVAHMRKKTLVNNMEMQAHSIHTLEKSWWKKHLTFEFFSYMQSTLVVNNILRREAHWINHLKC